MNTFRTTSTFFLATIVVLTTGCRTSGQGQAWSGKFRWKAEEYFDDDVAVSLCRAIRAGDVEKIDKLVAQGADVNELGKHNMTPLLWAFGGNHETFKRLLEHGADPNAVVQSDFNSRHAIAPGDSVTHLACNHPDKAYFDLVYDHGGDPNLLNPVTQESPLFKVARAGLIDAERRASRLVELGADVNHVDDSWKSVIMVAASWGGQYDLALLLLQKGADHRVRYKESVLQFVHVVAIEDIRRVPHLPPDHQAAHARLVKWLESHGESIEAAKADIARWEQGEGSPENIERQMRAELKKLEEKEAQLKRESKVN